MTRSAALRVPFERGEVTRRALLEERRLRTDLRIRRDGESLLLPLVDGAARNGDPGTLVEADFVPITGNSSAARYQDLVRCEPGERARLPRSFDVVGDIVLVRIPPTLERLGPAIGEALLGFVPGARIVGRDLGVHGPERRRTLLPLAGSGGWRTVHRENGLAIQVDVEQAYFSPRLAREHAAVAHAVGVGEVVYDLCCGVGPFSLAIAREGGAARVVAVDSNPAAIELLRESLRGAKGGNRVEPVEGEVGAFVAAAGPVDRVILNLPHAGIKYLAKVARLVRPGGAIHYYEVVARDALPSRAGELVSEVGEAPRWEAFPPRIVHPYSPRSDLVSFTLTATGAV